MTAKTDRTWELPKRFWIMRMTWSALLFAHWPVEPRILAPQLPKGLILDIRDGERRVGIGNAISEGHRVVYYPHLLVHPDYFRCF